MIAYLFETILPFLLTCSAIVVTWAVWDLVQEARENE
jgi:hypothetical protein